jgi:hypothetical protein
MVFEAHCKVAKEHSKAKKGTRTPKGHHVLQEGLMGQHQASQEGCFALVEQYNRGSMQ